MRNISWCPCLKVRVNFLPRRNYAAHFTVMCGGSAAACLQLTSLTDCSLGWLELSTRISPALFAGQLFVATGQQQAPALAGTGRLQISAKSAGFQTQAKLAPSLTAAEAGPGTARCQACTSRAAARRYSGPAAS